MFAIVAYLWTLMERRHEPGTPRAAGVAALIWRFVLTTGTGSIFAFLVARQAYQSMPCCAAVHRVSFAWGLAVFLIVQAAPCTPGTAITLPRPCASA